MVLKTVTDELQGAQPLYEQIKTAIERRIREATWPADFQVPREETLAEEFGASNLTVRRALRELQAEGMIVRIQGRGTFVVGPRMQCAIFELRDVSEEIKENGGVHTSDVLVLEVLPPDSAFANMLPVPPGTKIFHSRLLHKEDGTPIQLEDRFVNALEAPDYLKQDFTRITPHAYLQRETQVTYIDNTIKSIRADDASRRVLELDANQPCLLLDRRTWRDNIALTRSRFLYPGDRYRLRSTHEAASGRVASVPTNELNMSTRRIR